MLVDSHCHLDFPELATDADGVVARARAAGVGTMVTIGTELARFAGVLAMAERFDNVWCSVGTHPHESARERITDPAPLLVQLRHVMSASPAKARPSAVEPVRMSWVLGWSPRPFTMSPFSVRAVCFVSALPGPCRSSTLLAMTVPFEFVHGPVPMRSRAFTASDPWVLR